VAIFSDRPQRINQSQRILELLRSHAGDWVPLPEILELHIAQYSARIHELRLRGHKIESRQDGSRSWFRLLPDAVVAPVPKREPRSAKQGELFAPVHWDRG
jgi:hypothetical protein